MLVGADTSTKEAKLYPNTFIFEHKPCFFRSQFQATPLQASVEFNHERNTYFNAWQVQMQNVQRQSE